MSLLPFDSPDPVQPPKVVDPNDPNSDAKKAADEAARLAQSQARGRAATILTSGQGVLTSGASASKMLLGN